MCGVKVAGVGPSPSVDSSIPWATTPRPVRRRGELRFGPVVLGPAVWLTTLGALVVLAIGRRTTPIFQVQALIVLGSLGAVCVAVVGRVVAAWFCDCRVGWIRFGASDLDVEFSRLDQRLPLRSLALISLGGPFANLQVCAALVLAAMSVPGHPLTQLLILNAAPVNLWLGIRGLLPLPTLFRHRPTDGLIALRAWRAARTGSELRIDPTWLGVRT